MRSNRKTWIGLAMGVMLATGASTAGVDQAREWQRQGDLASAGHQWDIAYAVYLKIAEVFPDTAHGRVAAARARRIRAKMLSPVRPPVAENPGSWFEELIDFLVWP